MEYNAEIPTDEDALSAEKIKVADAISEPLAQLYRLCDGDEITVGEIMDEVHKVAQINAANEADHAA